MNASTLPRPLREAVLAGTPETQTYRTPSGTAEIVIGVPIPSVHAAYFDVFDLSDLDHTLRVLGLTLFGAGVVTTLLGVALGRFASRRLLQPLADVTQAAGAIAGGDLDTRLDAAAADPDLQGLTNSFNTMVDEIQERIEREARFNSDVSHELRSPLTTLAAAVEVLEADRDKLPSRSQRALQLLSDDLRRFQRMVGELLEMSRADAGSVDVFLEEVNVAELVRRSVETGFAHMDRHDNPIPPSVRVGTRPWPRGTWESTSAASSASWSTCSRTPTTTGAAPPRWVSARDRDTLSRSPSTTPGPASTSPSAAVIFERFYRGSASGRRGAGRGTGLGLALVAEHMRVMRGSVRVDTSPEGGARFVLALPALWRGDDSGSADAEGPDGPHDPDDPDGPDGPGENTDGAEALR